MTEEALSNGNISRRGLLLGAASMAGLSSLIPNASEAQTAAPRVPSTEPVTDWADDVRRSAFAASLLGGGKRITRRKCVIRGLPVEYDTTLGGVQLLDSTSKPSAIFVYMAYTRSGEDLSKRPITFAWNGGPSGPASGVHFGVLGPRLHNGKSAAGGAFRDNPDSILDRSDLVMVDPVATGFSVAAGQHKFQDFYSVSSDAASVAQFIRRYLEESGRLGAPVYLLGESYGTMRLPVVVSYLQSSGAAVTGAAFIASALDGNTLWTSPGHLAPYYLKFPNYAAIARYHERQPHQAPDLDTVMKEAGISRSPNY